MPPHVDLNNFKNDKSHLVYIVFTATIQFSHKILFLIGLKKNITYHSVVMDHVLADPDHPSWISLKKMMEEGIKANVVRPFVVQVFAADCLKEAFRTAGEVQDKKVILMVNISCQYYYHSIQVCPQGTSSYNYSLNDMNQIYYYISYFY